MRILVTGGCGFVGTNLVRRLSRESGVQICVLDNDNSGRCRRILPFVDRFTHADIRDRAAVERALSGVDAVVHLAADASVMSSLSDPLSNFQINVGGTVTLLEAMRAQGVARLVNASTGGAIIGNARPPVHEAMVPHPISPYGASKLAAEGYCLAYAESLAVETVSLRFANVYGPWSFHQDSVVAAFLKCVANGEPITVYGDGEQRRDFVYVEDLCEGIILALSNACSGVLQLGSGAPCSINQLIALIQAVVAPLPVRVGYRPARAGEVEATWCDIGLAQQQLGFSPTTPLAQGVANAWAALISEGRKAA